MKIPALLFTAATFVAVAAATKKERAVLLKQQPLKGGAATQGLAVGEKFFYGSNAKTICRFDKNWELLAKKTITIKGANHLGAIHYRDGFIWGGFLNPVQVDGKSDPTQNRSIIAKIRAKDFKVMQTWDVTWIDPVCFVGTHVWVGDLGLHRYRLTDGKLTRDWVLRYPKAMHFSQGIRVVGRKLYTIHTFGTMDGLFEFDIPVQLTDAIQQPTRVWPIQETKMHLEGFAFVPGQPNKLWHAQGRQVDLYKLKGLPTKTR